MPVQFQAVPLARKTFTPLFALDDAELAQKAVAYVHVHNARPGRFNCRIERADVPAS